MIHTIEDRIKNGQFILIAEIGVNYYDIAREKRMSPMEAAKLMIREAVASGIHAVKFQTYKADTIAATESPAYWDTNEEPTKSQYELFKKFDSFGEREYKELAQYSEDMNIEFLSTPFDVESSDYLETLMNVYKISSSDLNNIGFVRLMAQKNKPIILSVGASNADEIDRTVSLIRQYNDKPITLLHCVLEYPTPYEHANLYKIKSLKERYPDCIVGYSDHTKPDEGYDVLKMAYCLGARVIEKHFTLNKSLKGNDHYHAMDAEDARKIIKAIEKLEMIGGNKDLVCLKTEKTARLNARRSLVAVCDISEGSTITKDMITWKRPGTGISAEEFDNVIGMKAIRSIRGGEIIQADAIGMYNQN